MYLARNELDEKPGTIFGRLNPKVSAYRKSRRTVQITEGVNKTQVASRLIRLDTANSHH
jgi:hypothetical protein